MTSDDPPAQTPRHTARAEWTLVRGSPLARGVTYGFIIGLSVVLTLLLWIASSFVAFQFGVFVGPWPWAPIALIASWPVALLWMRHSARSQSVAVEVFEDRVRLASRRGELVFPVATSQVVVDVLEFWSGYKYGQPRQVWTLLVLRSGDSVFSLGARGSRVKPSGFGAMPTHACDRKTLVAIAKLWKVHVP
jgi:hypothetical protein